MSGRPVSVLTPARLMTICCVEPRELVLRVVVAAALFAIAAVLR